MKDNALRRFIKKAALICYRIDLAASRAWWRWKIGRPYLISGECVRCGVCCEEPAIRAGGLVWYFPLARKLFLFWQRRVNGFDYVEHDVQEKTFVFRCTHLDPDTRLCDSYHSRPGMCRDFPRIHLYDRNPRFFSSCGYRPVLPGADDFVSTMKQHGVTDEQIERMKDDLFLK